MNDLLDEDAGVDPFDFGLRRQVAKQHAFRSADGVPVLLGAIFWDNNLDAVRVTEVAATVYGMPVLGTDFNFHSAGDEVAWHNTEDCRPPHRRGSYDAGPLGRLVSAWEGIIAEVAVAMGCYSIAEFRAAQKESQS